MRCLPATPSPSPAAVVHNQPPPIIILNVFLNQHQNREFDFQILAGVMNAVECDCQTKRPKGTQGDGRIETREYPGVRAERNPCPRTGENGTRWGMKLRKTMQLGGAKKSIAADNGPSAE